MIILTSRKNLIDLFVRETNNESNYPPSTKIEKFFVRHGQKEDNVKTQEKTVIYKPGDRSSIDLSWQPSEQHWQHLDFRLLAFKAEIRNFYYLIYPVYGTLLWQVWQSNTVSY